MEAQFRIDGPIHQLTAERVQQRLEHLPGVTSATVAVPQRTVYVMFVPERATTATLRKTIERCGLHISDVATQPKDIASDATPPPALEQGLAGPEPSAAMSRSVIDAELPGASEAIEEPGEANRAAFPGHSV